MTLGIPDSPHDRLAKAVFRREAGARALLSVGLPATMLSRLDLSTIRFEPGELFSADLSLGIADLVMTVPLRDGTGPVTFVFVLFEHLSTPHRMAVADLLIDASRLWDNWRRRNPDANGLPRIVPFVLHHGPAGWKGPHRFRDLLFGDASTRAAFDDDDPTFPVRIVDLAISKPGFVHAVGVLDAFAGAALALMRDARTARALQGLREIGDLLRTVLRNPGGVSALRQLIVYYLVVNEKSGKHAQGVDRVISELESILPKDCEIPPNSLAAELIERGFEEGVERGIEKGIEKGVLRGIARSIEATLSQRFGALDPEITEKLRLRAATLDDDRIAHLVVAAATCVSISEFEGFLDS